MKMKTDTVWAHDSFMPDLVGGIRVTSFIPAQLLGGRVLFFSAGMNARVFLDDHNPACVVLNKPSNSDALVMLATAARDRRTRIITMIIDWHFGDDAVSRRYRRMVELSDDVIVQTAPMAGLVKSYYGVEPTIIEEPLEYPHMPPLCTMENPLRLLWFMSAGNYDTIAPGLAELEGIDAEIILLCSSIDQIQRHLPPKHPDAIHLKIARWSVGLQFDLMQQSDLIFIPSIDNPRKHVKGHNRVTESINAGRLAVAYPLSQYRELEDYCILDEHPGRGIRQALEATDNLDRIIKGQDYIRQRFTPEIIAAKWRKTIDG